VVRAAPLVRVLELAVARQRERREHPGMPGTMIESVVTGIELRRRRRTSFASCSWQRNPAP
jgi:hypothetical protein